MDFRDWYTDAVDVWRVTKKKTGNLTRQEREKVLEAVPCRVYRSDDRGPAMTSTASYIKQTNRLALDLSVDVHAGDELIITRGGGLGYAEEVIRAFAGTPNRYYEPFGAVIPGLAHQEIILLEEERIK